MYSLKSAFGTALILFLFVGVALTTSATATAASIPSSFQLSATLSGGPINLGSTGAGIDHLFENLTRSNSIGFDPSTSVDVGANVFNILGNLAGLSWQNGDALVYGNGGGTSIAGMVDGDTYFMINATIVPEPSTAMLLGLGLLAMGSQRRRS